jgi:undecaprenyl-diphosphatase
MNTWELPVLYWIREHLTCPFFDWLMPAVSALSAHGEIWILLAAVLVCIPKTRRVGLTMGVTLLLGFLIGNVGLKNIIARVRPYDVATDVTLLVERLHDFAFPSGHTLASFGAATALTLTHRRWGAAALVLAAAIGFSRLYLFVHYPTDVVAGALLGVALAFAARWLVNCLYNKKNSAT